MGKTCAEVAIKTPIKKTFTYLVTDELKSAIALGKRAWVPFSRGERVGYIVGLSDEAEVSYKVKEIIDVLDEEPVFSEEMLQLTKWMASYYMCSWGEVLDSILPTGVKITSQRIVSLTGDKSDLWERFFKKKIRPPKQEKIVRLLLDKGEGIPIRTIYSTVGKRGTYTAISSLQREGVIKISSVVTPPEVKPKVVRMAQIADESPRDRIEEIARRAPKQAEILKILLREGGRFPVGELVKLAGTDSSVVKRLKDKGFIDLCEVTVDRNPISHKDYVRSDKYTLTPEQQRALDEICRSIEGSELNTMLLHGVTGSGKTEVYLQAMEYALSKGKRAIVLVPEISLTPQTVERFKSRFPEGIALLHSKLSKGERYDEWRRIKRGEASIVIGARSAVFAPLENLGLVVIDEEHETSYKQDSTPRYHARDVAIMRAKLNGATVVLGTATPTLESYHNTFLGKFKLMELPKRIDNRPMPKVEVVDMREELKKGNASAFSWRLRSAIKNCLDRGEQAILFLNRRGYATFILCPECGYVVQCPNCNITLTYHRSKKIALCHYCNYQKKAPDVCPNCDGINIRYSGVGTQKIESELKAIYPEARTARMDIDTTGRKRAHEDILSLFSKGEFDILVGTQMVAKGLDFPNVTLVGVINADTGLNIPDFRSGERTFSLITQVAGRTGRGLLGGKVIVQTYDPGHYSISCACQHDYLSFYKTEAKLRSELSYPPFTKLINVTIHGPRERDVIKAASDLDGIMTAMKRKSYIKDIIVMGPAPAPLSKIKNKYRWQIILKGNNYKRLHIFLERALDGFGGNRTRGGVGITVDVDPVNVM